MHVREGRAGVTCALANVLVSRSSICLWQVWLISPANETIKRWKRPLGLARKVNSRTNISPSETTLGDTMQQQRRANMEVPIICSWSIVHEGLSVKWAEWAEWKYEFAWSMAFCSFSSWDNSACMCGVQCLLSIGNSWGPSGLEQTTGMGSSIVLNTDSLGPVACLNSTTGNGNPICKHVQTSHQLCKVCERMYLQRRPGASRAL